MKERYVLGFAFNLLGTRVVLIEKNRPAFQKGYLNGIGGITKYEALQDAMVREFKEETGLETETGAWQRKIVMKKASADIHVFVAYLSEHQLSEVKDCRNVYIDRRA